MRPATFLAAALAAALAAGAASAEPVLDRLRTTGEIRLGVRTDAAPLSARGPDGTHVGYTVAVCERVAEHLAKQIGRDALTIAYVEIDTEDRFQAVADGRIDLLCGNDTVTLDRREVVDFSLPVYIDGAAVILKRGADPELSALAGKKAGVRAGTTTEEALHNALDAAGVAAEIVPFEDHPAGLAALQNDEIAAYFGDQSILYNLLFAADATEELVISDNLLTVEKQALALARGDTDFRLAVDRALSSLYADGSMGEIFETSFPGATPGLALKALFLIAPDLP